MRLLLVTIMGGLCMSGVTLAQTAQACGRSLDPALLSAPTACPQDSMYTLCTIAPLVQAGSAAGVSTVAQSAGFDLTDVTTINTVADASTGEWGIAYTRLAAFAAESWEMESLILLAFGQTQVSDVGQLFNDTVVEVSVLQGVNIRRAPREAATIIATAMQGDLLMLAGRLADSGWLQVHLRDGRVGWVAPNVLETSLSLPVVTDETPIDGGDKLPFNAVRIATDDVICAGASPSGVLLQVLSDASAIALSIEDVPINLAGTLLVQTSADQTQLFLLNLAGNMVLKRTEADIKLAVGKVARFERLAVTDVWGFVDADRAFDYEAAAHLPLNLLPEPFYVPVDIKQIVRPRPEGDISPIASMLATDACRITTGEGGTNIRAGAGTNYPIQAVMGYRESADVLGRAVGSDGQNWWNIGAYLWINGLTTVSGGDCVAVTEIPNQPPR